MANPKIMQYLGDDGPHGHIALLSDGRRVVIPSHHCLSVGDEYVESAPAEAADSTDEPAPSDPAAEA